MSLERGQLKLLAAHQRAYEKARAARSKRYWDGLKQQTDLLKTIIFKEGLLNRVTWRFAWRGTAWCNFYPVSGHGIDVSLGELRGVYGATVELDETADLRVPSVDSPYLEFHRPEDAIVFAEKHSLHVNWAELVEKEQEAREAADKWTRRLMRAQAIQLKVTADE